MQHTVSEFICYPDSGLALVNSTCLSHAKARRREITLCAFASSRETRVFKPSHCRTMVQHPSCLPSMKTHRLQNTFRQFKVLIIVWDVALFLLKHHNAVDPYRCADSGRYSAIKIQLMNDDSRALLVLPSAKYRPVPP